jgi:hypothetical protein
MSDTAVRIHLERLVSMEYVRAVAGRNGQRFEYELLFDGDLGATSPQMIGLIDATVLRTADSAEGAQPADTTATSQGEAPDLAPGLQATRTELAPASPNTKSAATAGAARTANAEPASSAEKALLRSAGRGGRSASLTRSCSSESSLLAASSGG